MHLAGEDSSTYLGCRLLSPGHGCIYSAGHGQFGQRSSHRVGYSTATENNMQSMSFSGNYEHYGADAATATLAHKNKRDGW